MTAEEMRKAAKDTLEFIPNDAVTVVKYATIIERIDSKLRKTIKKDATSTGASVSGKDLYTILRQDIFNGDLKNTDVLMEMYRMVLSIFNYYTTNGFSVKIKSDIYSIIDHTYGNFRISFCWKTPQDEQVQSYSLKDLRKTCYRICREFCDHIDDLIVRYVVNLLCDRSFYSSIADLFIQKKEEVTTKWGVRNSQTYYVSTLMPDKVFNSVEEARDEVDEFLTKPRTWEEAYEIVNRISPLKIKPYI